MDHLKAVFWDYPQFDTKNLAACLKENRRTDLYFWIMKRFLEYGRVVDTLRHFSLSEIAESLPGLQLSPLAAKKWKRLIEVYHGD